MLLGANVLMPAAAVAIEPPGVDPAALPPDDTPGPDQEMKQQNTCADPLTVADPDVTQPAPGNVMLDITKAWKYSTGAGVTVGLIDTGVTPNPRFPALFAGGDYVMGDENGGLFDCDSHGTVVASIIAAQPSDPGAKPPPMPPGVDAPPPPPGVPASPFPTTPPPPPPKPSTVTVTAPPPPPPAAEPPPGEPVAPAAGPGDGELPPVPGPPPGSPDGVVGVAPDAALISVRQSSSAFGPARPQPGDNDEIRRKAGDIATLARAVVHLANLGVKVMNISVTACINAASPSIRRRSVPPSATPRWTRTSSSWRPRATKAKAPRADRTRCSTRCGPTTPATGTTCPPSSRPPGSPTTSSRSARCPPTANRCRRASPVHGSASRHPVWRSWACRASTAHRSTRCPAESPGKATPLSGTSFATAYTSGVAALVRAKYPDLSAHQIIRRITETAHNPPRGVDNKVGYGVVDPVAALTFDVAPGDRLPPEHLTSLLHVPTPPPPPDLRPRHTALIGAAVVAALAAAVAATAAVRRRRS